MAVQTLTARGMVSTPTFAFHRLPKRGHNHKEDIPVVGINKGNKVEGEILTYNVPIWIDVVQGRSLFQNNWVICMQ